MTAWYSGSKRAVFLVLWCIVTATPAIAQTKAAEDAFKAGLSARDGGRWADMADQMRLAIQSDPKETERKVGRVGVGPFAVGGTEYLPHYFLGLALLNSSTSNCTEAVNEWILSEQQGVVTKLKDYPAIIKQGYSKCEAAGVLSPTSYKTQQDDVTRLYDEANTIAGRVVPMLNESPPPARTNFRDRYEEIRKELQGAHDRITSAQRTRKTSDFSMARATVTRVLPTLRGLEDELGKAIEATRTTEGLADTVRQLIDRASSLDRELEPVAGSLTAELRTARQAGRQNRDDAQTHLDEGLRSRDPGRVGEARNLANTAVSTLLNVVERSQQLLRDTQATQIADAIRAVTEKFAFADNSLAVVDRLARERPAALKPGTLGERQAVEEELKSLRRRLGRAQEAQNLARLKGIDREILLALGRLDSLMKSFGPVTLRDRGVSAALEEGARQYFQRQYREAIAALEPAGDSGGGALQLHVHLFRAASQYALYVVGAERDENLRTKVVQEIERCKQIDPAFQPDESRFSPRFVAIYRQPNRLAPTAATASAR